MAGGHNGVGQLTFFQALKCFNRRLALTCLLVAISPFNYGFDNQGFTSIQSMDYFYKQFGDYDEKTGEYFLPTWWLSLFNAIPFVTFFFGIIFGSIVSRKYGRRMCIFVMGCWALMSAAVIISSRSRAQITAGRILNYFYVGMELVCLPVYQSEITPGPVRGVTVGAYHVALVAGGLVVNCIAAGTSQIQSNASWIIPFGLYFTVPTIVVSTIWLLPESPRWLVMQERDEEARRNLHLLRVGAYTEEQIEAEWQQTLRGIRQEQAMTKRGMGAVFEGLNRRRTLTVIFINVFLQCTGQQFASSYGAIYVKSLGTISQFYILIIMAVINLIIGFFVMYLQDRIGRRMLLFIGGGTQAAALICMGGLGCAPAQTLAVKNAVVAMMVIYVSAYTAGWAGVAQTLNSEVPNTELRDATFRVGCITVVICQIVMTYAIPYMLNKGYGNLQSKVGFIFGAITVVGLVFTYFCVPDCRGRTLEDVDRLFRSGIPARRFHKVDINTLPDAAAEGKALDGGDEGKIPVTVHEEERKKMEV